MYGALAAVAFEAETEDGHLADNLHARLDDFRAVDVDLAPNLVVQRAER